MNEAPEVSQRVTEAAAENFSLVFNRVDGVAGVANAAPRNIDRKQAKRKRQEKKLSLTGEWRKIISNARQWKLFTNCRSNFGDARLAQRSGGSRTAVAHDAEEES